MPYKWSLEHKKLPPELDRRIKLTESQRLEIKARYELGGVSQRALAREYKVSRRLVTFCIDPSKREHAASLFIKRRKDGRYKPTKNEWAAIMRNHRAYKQSLKDKLI